MAKNLFYVSDPPPREMPADHLNAFGTPYLLSQITAKHLNFPTKEPRARSNCLPWKLQLDPNEASLKLTDL